MELEKTFVGDWNNDLGMSNVSERYVLTHYLKQLYPNAEKKEGYVKSHDYMIPELDYCTVELKTDLESNNTTNLFIEYKCRDMNGNFQPSGIASTNAKFWLISDGCNIFHFDYDVLIEMYNNRWSDDNEDSIYRIRRCKSENESEGFIIPSHYLYHDDKIVHEIPKNSYGHLSHLKTLRD